jgi:hypothetical protein
MAIMELSRSNRSEVFDPIREIWVAALPEEQVRQKLLQKMLSHLGFPKAHLAVEKELKELPHLANSVKLPERRVDILAFAPELHPFFPLSPLLLIECKEGAIGQGGLDQLLGYNHYVQAPFLAVAGEKEIRFLCKQSQQTFSFLPHYTELVNAARR